MELNKNNEKIYDFKEELKKKFNEKIDKEFNDFISELRRCRIVNSFLDNFYKDIFLYSIGVK